MKDWHDDNEKQEDLINFLRGQLNEHNKREGADTEASKKAFQLAADYLRQKVRETQEKHDRTYWSDDKFKQKVFQKYAKFQDRRACMEATLLMESSLSPELKETEDYQKLLRIMEGMPQAPSNFEQMSYKEVRIQFRKDLIKYHKLGIENDTL